MGDNVLFKTGDYKADWYAHNWPSSAESTPEDAPFWNLKSSPADGSKPVA